ncbi:NAD-dependent protein deacetylase sirtuin-3, mitochondrial-like [Zootermopsis nevadensis]|uniref:NAD-dependent protein deacetylase n=1 Tax=Zootermopsis nevadensis TaxID=136037 RepID=A0A067R5P7_ZOONE|nr:NAD-dependent protein deacetylase sirtuin-3, mitochondrial-like [Zootermopsis nevadensis]KDR18595.1 NAD-dependent deacetylase sirtuin-3, mitochondrial [Zootermopsis nevadensis]
MSSSLQVMRILWQRSQTSYVALKFVSLQPVTCHLRYFSKDFNLSADSLKSFANHLKERSSNVLVMAGAGLSTPSGIPDFRSPGTGLYYNLKQYNLPYPEAIFDLVYFEKDPRPFLTLAKELYPGGKYQPNLGHHFVHLLHKKGKLLRMYTQNIDGLERLSGIPEEKLVEAHGGFSTSSCIRCSKKHDPYKTREAILQGKTVYCDRSFCKGLVKPDIVFFGEALPDRFWLHEMDTSLADFLIVIGTSLEVYPFSSVADAVQFNIPRLLLNRTAVGSFGNRDNDAILSDDIIESVKNLAIALGWMNELEELVRHYEQNK